MLNVKRYSNETSFIAVQIRDRERGVPKNYRGNRGYYPTPLLVNNTHPKKKSFY